MILVTGEPWFSHSAGFVPVAEVLCVVAVPVVGAHDETPKRAFAASSASRCHSRSVDSRTGGT